MALTVAMTLSADGTQLLMLSDNSSPEVRFVDLASGREVRRVKLSGDPIDSSAAFIQRRRASACRGLTRQALQTLEPDDKERPRTYTGNERIQPHKVQS